MVIRIKLIINDLKFLTRVCLAPIYSNLYHNSTTTPPINIYSLTWHLLKSLYNAPKQMECSIAETLKYYVLYIKVARPFSLWQPGAIKTLWYETNPNPILPNAVQIELVFKDKLRFFRVSIAINIIDMPHSHVAFCSFSFSFYKTSNFDNLRHQFVAIATAPSRRNYYIASI